MELPERRRWGKWNELHAAFQSFGTVRISECVQIGWWRLHVTCWAIEMVAMVTYSNWHTINHAWFNEPNPHSLLKRVGCQFFDILIPWGKKNPIEIWSCRYPNVSGFPQAGHFHGFKHEQFASWPGNFFLSQSAPWTHQWLKPQMMYSQMSVVELSGDPEASKTMK